MPLVAGLGVVELIIVLVFMLAPIAVVGGGIYWLVRLAARHGARDAARSSHLQRPPDGFR